jgi:hypothetical protein
MVQHLTLKNKLRSGVIVHFCNPSTGKLRWERKGGRWREGEREREREINKLSMM